MSFSADVKAELVRYESKGRHCRIAELAAVIAFAGRLTGSQECAERLADSAEHAGHLTGSQGHAALQVDTENNGLARKFLTLVRQVFGFEVELEVVGSVSRRGNRQRNYRVQVCGSEKVEKMLHTLRMIDDNGRVTVKDELVNGLLVQRNCCQRAFIRGAFLSAGSISDPGKSYHFEIVCASAGKAGQLQSMINSFGVDSKVVERKRHYVVYLKEGSQIVDILNVMEAHKALMDLENVRILKNMRNNVNRQVNCETANINKTVNAAVRQIEDIQYIKERIGLEKLPANLRETAQMRLEYPEASLLELGSYLTPPVGKSGVNHRLRKISKVAENLKTKGD